MRRAWPFVIAPFSAVAYFTYERLVAELAATAAKSPNQAMDRVWGIEFRGGAIRYVKLWEYVTLMAPVYLAPAIVITALIVVFSRRPRHRERGKGKGDSY